MTFTVEIDLQGVYSLVPSDEKGSSGEPASYLAVLPRGTSNAPGTVATPGDRVVSVDAAVCRSRGAGETLLPHRPLVVFEPRDVEAWRHPEGFSAAATDLKAVWNFAGSRISFDPGPGSGDVQFAAIDKTIPFDTVMDHFKLAAYSRIAPEVVEGSGERVAAQVLIDSGRIVGKGSRGGQVRMTVPGSGNPPDLDLGSGVAASLKISFECEDVFRIEARSLGASRSAPPASVLELSPADSDAAGSTVELAMGSFCQNPLGWGEFEGLLHESQPASSIAGADLPDVDFKWLYRMRQDRAGLARHLESIGMEAPVPIFVQVEQFGSPFRCYFATEAAESFPW